MQKQTPCLPVQFLGLPTPNPMISTSSDVVFYAKKITKSPTTSVQAVQFCTGCTVLYSQTALSMPKPKPSGVPTKSLTCSGSCLGFTEKRKNDLQNDSCLQLPLQICHHRLLFQKVSKRTKNCHKFGFHCKQIRRFYLAQATPTSTYI